MKLIVYGTLKNGYGNHKILGHSKYLTDIVVPGFKLLYSWGNKGFPVAVKSDNDSFKGEVYEISEEILKRTDFLENEGVMYLRETVSDCFLYVGNPLFWNIEELTECEKIDNIFVWK